jgi:hypothetical protein
MKILLLILSLGVMAHASGTGNGAVSLGTTGTKGNVIKTGAATTSSAAYAEILTYTVTSGKTLFINALELEGRLTTPSATGAVLGACSMQIGRGSTVATFTFMNPSSEAADRVILPLAEPVTVSGGTVLVFSCIPAGSTSTLWQENFIGYEN